MALRASAREARKGEMMGTSELGNQAIIFSYILGRKAKMLMERGAHYIAVKNLDPLTLC